jgi:hypothetical protein
MSRGRLDSHDHGPDEGDSRSNYLSGRCPRGFLTSRVVRLIGQEAHTWGIRGNQGVCSVFHAVHNVEKMARHRFLPGF